MFRRQSKHQVKAGKHLRRGRLGRAAKEQVKSEGTANKRFLGRLLHRRK